jgi:large subunit ribosomal protein L3
MISAYVKDNTPDSMTNGKKIIIPLTILECPSMKIFSVRFYKNGKVAKEFLASNLDKELKRKVKMPKKGAEGKFEEGAEDIRLICYSVVKTTGIKKRPDMVEIGLTGSVEEKINFVKENLGKEMSALNIFEAGQLVDLRGLTKGKGLCGPVKRFGIKLKSHKSEKGMRRPGSLGPWHPARVIFRVPMAGQVGMFTRVTYNNTIVDLGSAKDRELKNIKNYGDIKTNYILVRGSIQGPAKRQLLITAPLRETRKQKKKDFELVELR